jgi:hypothetical protein
VVKEGAGAAIGIVRVDTEILLEPYRGQDVEANERRQGKGDCNRDQIDIDAAV